MQIRTIDQAYDIIAERDPDTALTRYLVKQMVKQGMVPAIKAGNKTLVDVDVLEAHIRKVAGVEVGEITEELNNGNIKKYKNGR